MIFINFRSMSMILTLLVIGSFWVLPNSLFAQALPQKPSELPQGIIQNNPAPPSSTSQTDPQQPQAKGRPNAQSPSKKIPPGQSNGMNVTLPEDVTAIDTSKSPSLVTQAVAITFVALLPYLVILLTAFIKVSVVLSLLRNALGLQQSPPNQVINGLALILSLYVMFPTGVAMYNAAKGMIEEPPTELISKESSAYIIQLVNVTKEPLREFLVRNTNPKHLKSFYQLAYKALPEDERGNLKDTDYLVLVPSYITSQLKDAYEIGVLIYLPFFVIDLVVSNILLAMGMMMLSPLTIALPLKLLLLVMIDGWTVLVQGLIMTFR